MECGDSCCGSGVLEAVHVVGNGHHQDLEWTLASCRMDTSGDTGKLHHIIAPGPDCTMVVTRIPLYLRCMKGTTYTVQTTHCTIGDQQHPAWLVFILRLDLRTHHGGRKLGHQDVILYPGENRPKTYCVTFNHLL